SEQLGCDLRIGHVRRAGSNTLDLTLELIQAFGIARDRVDGRAFSGEHLHNAAPKSAAAAGDQCSFSIQRIHDLPLFGSGDIYTRNARHERIRCASISRMSQAMRWSARARLIACVRLLTPNLPYSRLMCVLTVLTPSTSRSAISWLDSPSTINDNTSSSRS